MNKYTKCQMCDVCYFLEKNVSIVGFYCMHPQLKEPRLIIERPRYQLGIRSPRWCLKKIKKL